MNIYIASDHRGKELKDLIIKAMPNLIDLSKINDMEDDYPDFAFKLCEEVIKNNGLGILICGTGIGISIAANKVKGIRCARIVNEQEASIVKNENGTNVISFGSNNTINDSLKMINAFIDSKEENISRFVRRVNKIINYED